MVVNLRQTLDPENVAITALALRAFGQEKPATTPMETEFFQELERMKVDRDRARSMAERFYGKSRVLRRRVLGPLGEDDAELPETPVRGDVSSVTRAQSSVFRPRTRPIAIDPTGGVFAGEHTDPTPPDIVYGLNYKGMHCVDETHFDTGTSDEVYIITTVSHIRPLQPGQENRENVVNAIRHPFGVVGRKTYGDVDSHNTRLGPEVAVWDARFGEFEGGVSLTNVFMERDKGDPDYYRDEIENLVKVALAGVALKYPALAPVLKLEELADALSDVVNWFLPTDDDEIGHVTTVLDLFELEGYSQRRPVEYVAERKVPSNFGQLDTIRINTGLMHHVLVSVNDNDYFAGFEVVRTPPHDLTLPDVE